MASSISVDTEARETQRRSATETQRHRDQLGNEALQSERRSDSARWPAQQANAGERKACVHECVRIGSHSCTHAFRPPGGASRRVESEALRVSVSLWLISSVSLLI